MIAPMLNLAKAYVLYPAVERYLKRDIRSKVETLRREYARPAGEKLERQKRQLIDILSDARVNVPYYRDLFQSIRFDPEKIAKSTEYLQEVPLLTKEILREQGERMINQRFPRTSLQERRTNGSTGLITHVFYDQESIDWTAAVNLFVSELGGRKSSDIEVHLSSQFFDEMPFREVLREQVKCWALNRVNVLTHSFDDAGLEKLLSDLRSAHAAMVQGHPSTLYHLAVYVQRTGKKAKGLMRIFESTGESIDPQKAKLIEETFGCRVFNRYGNAEFGVLAHSRETVAELEVLDYLVYPESHSVGNGLEEIVLTGLKNPAMPFIRYKTGDIGEVFYKNQQAYIRNLNGRIHDLIRIDGKDYPSHYLKDVLERLGGIDEFQVVEKQGEATRTLKIVPQPQINKAAIEAKLQELFGNAFRVEYVGFDGLTLQGWRDKFRYVVRV